jgi:hypothetical protein
VCHNGTSGYADVFPSFQKRLGITAKVVRFAQMSTCRGVILQLVFRHCASTVHVEKKFDTHNVVFESETCGTADFLEGTKGETRQLDNSNSIGTNDDRGVVGIRLREMSDLGREGLWVSVLGGFASYAFLSLRGL